MQSSHLSGTTFKAEFKSHAHVVLGLDPRTQGNETLSERPWALGSEAEGSNRVFLA